MQPDKPQLTRTGYERLKEELALLKEKRTITIAEVKAARELGDLKENADYHAAREAYGWIEGQIKALEKKLADCVILEEGVEITEVDLGIPVTVQIEGRPHPITYTVVDGSEVSFVDNGISVESPLGEALLFRKVGETFEAETPRGEMKITVLSIGDAD